MIVFPFIPIMNMKTESEISNGFINTAIQMYRWNLLNNLKNY